MFCEPTIAAVVEGGEILRVESNGLGEIGNRFVVSLFGILDVAAVVE